MNADDKYVFWGVYEYRILYITKYIYIERRHVEDGIEYGQLGWRGCTDDISKAIMAWYVNKIDIDVREYLIKIFGEPYGR